MQHQAASHKAFVILSMITLGKIVHPLHTGLSSLNHAHPPRRVLNPLTQLPVTIENLKIQFEE